jgi:hypothetical protein
MVSIEKNYKHEIKNVLGPNKYLILIKSIIMGSSLKVKLKVKEVQGC